MCRSTALRAGVPCLILGLSAACAPRPADEPRAPDGAPRVEILAPAAGDTVDLPFTVRLAAHGVDLVPASGLREEGQGHHHLVFDADLPTGDGPLPVGGGFIHVGTGVGEWVVDSLPAGPHRLIAVLGYGDHVPMRLVATDTVWFVVR
jgi:hypothetical protein